MKNSIHLFGLIVMMLVSVSSFAQSEEYQAENEGWLVNVEDAFTEHQSTGKPILANFTGSDWCGWCKRLTKSVFIHDEFKDWAKDNVVLLELDYPKRKQLPEDIQAQNRSMQQAFGIRGYPTIYVFDLSKNDAGEFAISALGKTGYTKTVGEFTTSIEQMIGNR